MAFKESPAAESRQGKVYIAQPSETDSKRHEVQAEKAPELHTPGHEAIHAVIRMTKAKFITPHL